MAAKDVKVFLLQLHFQTQGKIKGSPTKNKGGLDPSNGIECHAFEYAVASQYDAGSGQTTGKRQHNPIKITREVDSASPLLWHALCTNEVFQSATLSFARPSTSGKQTVYQTITLTNGVISKIEFAQPLNGKRRQAITFSYEELAVDGAKNGAIPHSLLGPSFRGPWG